MELALSSDKTNQILHSINEKYIDFRARFFIRKKDIFYFLSEKENVLLSSVESVCVE